MNEPTPRRPSFPGCGIPEDAAGMLPWAWADERLARSHSDVEEYHREYDYRPEPGEGWYRVAPERVLAWREQD
jgi:hypothetical protein